MPSRNRPGGTHQWRKQRARAFADAGYTCCWHDDDGNRCTRACEEYHHIVAVEDGGTDNPANLTPLCHDHHTILNTQQNAARRRGIELNPSRDW